MDSTGSPQAHRFEEHSIAVNGLQRTSGASVTAPALGADEARQSCIACRKLKRKCSKEAPTCSLCGRVGRECEYPTPGSSPGAAKPTSSRKRSWAQANEISPYNGSDHTSSLYGPSSRPAPTFRPLSAFTERTAASSPVLRRFPAAWYIDSVLARGMEITIPHDLCWNEVEGVKSAVSLDDARESAKHYFQSTHHWFPVGELLQHPHPCSTVSLTIVVSLMRITRMLNCAGGLKSADTVALLVSMRLLAQGREKSLQGETQSAMYRSVKAAIAACEQHGQLSTDLLGAMVLTSMYEVAHGIYPAAYFTIGSCARACCTIGLHNKRFATQLTKGTDTWTEVEERRRLWWATLLLVC